MKERFLGGSSFSRNPHSPSRFQIGVDVVALNRVRLFLKQHAGEIHEKILVPSERSFVAASTKSPLLFAKIFSAKEAYFKTLNLSWLGLEGFKKIEIQLRSLESFQACWIEKGKRRFSAPGSWAVTPKHVIAQVIRGKS